ncbi:hypothetical protein Q8A67_024168 [Cirrhinus molitorella]|uniref:Uncharacterized protein n=1 Tax=Cirrhinus molitorella TaxID=172907 RepID=A0AA88T984_9TELE|nr:hypothetical protein Q8A67_024168 [Cirrhinus molitorella]
MMWRSLEVQRYLTSSELRHHYRAIEGYAVDVTPRIKGGLQEIKCEHQFSAKVPLTSSSEPKKTANVRSEPEAWQTAMLSGDREEERNGVNSEDERGFGAPSSAIRSEQR